MRSTNNLIVKLSSLGDIIHTIPFAYYLEGSIAWAVEADYQPLLEAVPAIDQVIPIPFRKWRRGECALSDVRKSLREIGRFNRVFDLQGNCKSALVTRAAKAEEKIGFARPAEWPNRLVTNRKIATPEHLHMSDQLRTFYQGYFGKNPDGAFIKLKGESPQISKPIYMVCMGSRWRNKQLPDATWKLFLQEIQKLHKVNFLFVSGEQEEPIAKSFPQSISLVKPDFGTWQNLMREVDMILTVDSASLALAGTTKTPTFALFGPSSAKVYGPKSGGAFQGSCPYGEKFVKRCAKLRTCKTGACLREVTLKELLEAFQNQCGFPPTGPLHGSSPYLQDESSLYKR